MRIDAHHHLWRYEPAEFGWITPSTAIARDFGMGELHPALAAAGVDGTIAVQARQSSAETRFLLEVARREPAVLGIVGWIDLRADDVATRLEDGADPLIVGYRHVVQDEPDPDFLLADAFVAGVRAVVGRGLAYDLLVDHRQLATVPRFLDRVGGGRFVLDHAAKPDIAGGGWQPWADRVAAVAAYPDMWCKVSGLVTEADHAAWTPADIDRYIDHLLALFGPERLVWGSDWPVCLLAASYGRVAELVADFVARACPDAEADIFGGNALRAYRPR